MAAAAEVTRSKLRQRQLWQQVVATEVTDHNVTTNDMTQEVAEN